MRLPFFRPQKGRWYINVGGKHVNLGPDKAAAFARYHQIMAERANPRPEIVNSDGTVYVASVIDAFVAWLKSEVAGGSKAQRTLDWYVDYLTSLLRYLRSTEGPGETGEPPAITIDKLEPYHVYQWLDSEPGWKTGRRGAMIAVQAAFNWAAKAGILKAIGGKSPVSTLQKPPQGRREQLVTDEEYREVLALGSDQQFTDLLELSWETGCRPHELFTVEASHVDMPNGRWVFPVKLSKGKKVQRVVYLNDRALTITQRLILKNPTGPLLRNTDGIAWCVSSVKCRFQHICREIGRRRLREGGLMPAKIPMLKAAQRKDQEVRRRHDEAVKARRQQVNDLARKHGLRLSLYLFRHAFITESLVNGLDAVTVSILAGHRDTTMISRHYSHLTQKHEHMRKAANQARAAS